MPATAALGTAIRECKHHPTRSASCRCDGPFLGTALRTRLAFYPLEIFGSIGRVPLPYLLTLGVFLFIFFLSVFAELVLVLVSPFIGALIAWGFSLYLSVVEARILGLLYYTNEKQLGWFS